MTQQRRQDVDKWPIDRTTPTTTRLWDGYARWHSWDSPKGLTVQEAVRWLGLAESPVAAPSPRHDYLDPGSGQPKNEDRLYVAAFNGQQFEVVTLHLEGVSGERWSGGRLGDFEWTTTRMEWSMDLFHPVDPRMTVLDVHGAIMAVPNTTRTAWVFRHADAGDHADYEFALLAAMEGVIQPLFRQYQLDAWSSTASTAAHGRAQYRLLAEFYGELIVQCRNAARAAHLGAREQGSQPDSGWLARDMGRALDSVSQSWSAQRSQDWTALTAARNYLTVVLTVPAPETRWGKAARIAAEAEEATK